MVYFRLLVPSWIENCSLFVLNFFIYWWSQTIYLVGVQKIIANEYLIITLLFYIQTIYFTTLMIWQIDLPIYNRFMAE